MFFWGVCRDSEGVREEESVRGGLLSTGKGGAGQAAPPTPISPWENKGQQKQFAKVKGAEVSAGRKTSNLPA